MKKCPYCAEEIQDEAIKCRYCKEFLEPRPPGVSPIQSSSSHSSSSAFATPTPVGEKGRPPQDPWLPPVRHRAEPEPWYQRTSLMVLALISVGPFALPLVFVNPHLSRLWKIIITVATLLLTWLLLEAFMAGLSAIRKNYDTIRQLGEM